MSDPAAPRSRFSLRAVPLAPAPPGVEQLVEAHGDGAGPAPALGGAPKPFGQWIAQYTYDPEEGITPEDFQTPADQIARRFALAPSDSSDHAIAVPGYAGKFIPAELGESTFLVPTEGAQPRWRPVRLSSRADLKALNESAYGRRRAFLEQQGTINLDFDWSGNAQIPSPTNLLDTEFIPLMFGPYYKQLYIYDYLYMHARAFNLVNHNALAASAVKILQRFTLGRGISYHIKDPEAKAVWDEFWVRNNMRRRLRNMARDLTYQGELMLRYLEPKPGFMTMRVHDPSACWEVVTDPEDIECVTGDTRIACLDGTNPTIADLAERAISADRPVWVYSYDLESHRVAPGKAVRCWKRPQSKQCVEVKLDSGETVTASHDHPFLRRDGQYVWAEHLRPGDRLMPLYRSYAFGYERVLQPGTTQFVRTHRLVAEGAVVGRPLTDAEGVHHVNENKFDNRPENLMVLDGSAHSALHQRARMADPAWRRRWVETVRASLPRRRPPTVDHERRTQTMRRRWKDPAQRPRLLAAGQRGRSAVSPEARRAATQAPERRRKISEKAVQRWKNPTFRREASRAMTTAWQRDGAKAARGDAMRRGWTPERRAAASARATAQWAARHAQQPDNHRVVAVRPVGLRDVYDLEIEQHHNYALAAGVFVHNSVYYYHFQWPAPYQLWVSGKIPVTKYIVQELPPTNIQHIKINCHALEKRGRSDLLPAMTWLKRFDDYYNGAALKKVLEANLVWIITVRGDQADVNALLANTALTQMPPPGGTWLQNEAVKLEPATGTLTGSRGADDIGAQIAAIVATSLNLPTEYFNVAGTAGGARATALVRTDPAVKAIEDRQQLFRESVEEIYDRVIAAALLAGRISKRAARAEPETRPGEPGDPATLVAPLGHEVM